MMTQPATTDCRLPDEETEALSHLAGALYDAALDADLWPSALALASCYVGGSASAIYEWALTGASRGFIHDDGRLEPSFKSLYFQHYARLDPVALGHRAAALGEPFSVADVIDVERYRKTRFYREWSQPQRIVDLLAAPIEKSSGGAVVFGVILREPEGMADAAMRARMRLVVPHVRRAMTIGRVYESTQSHADDLSATLDGLSTGLFIVGDDGRVLHANAAGQHLAAARNAVVLRDSGLTAVDPGAARAIAAALAGPADPPAPGRRGLDVPIAARDGTRFAAHILPLGSANRLPGARAAIFVHPAETVAPAAPGLVGRAYGLTAAEQRVLAHIIEAGSIAEAAERLRVSPATVKTHLQRIFSKTGTARQAELVRLVAGFAGPLAR